MRFSVFVPTGKSETGGKLRNASTLEGAIKECKDYEEVWITPELTDSFGSVIAAVEECKDERRFWHVVRLW